MRKMCYLGRKYTGIRNVGPGRQRIIQVEKVLVMATRKETPTYCPPPESIKKLFFAAIDLQSKRKRRLARCTPMYFMAALLPEDKKELIQRYTFLIDRNVALKKRMRLKRRRFYNRPKGKWRDDWQRKARRRHVYDEYE